MKLFALLSYYDEDPTLLEECIASLPKAGVSHVVAVDGSYRLWGKPAARSQREQRFTVDVACAAHGLGLTHHAPTEPWFRNETGKRSFMHRLAATLAHSEDWFLVIDADEVVDVAPARLFERLADDRVAAVRFREAGGGEEWRRRLFGEEVWLRGDHVTYVAKSDGHVLAGQGPHVSSALTLDDFVMVHRPHRRTWPRDQLKRAYYELGHEGVRCQRCGAPATTVARTGWRMIEGEVLSDPMAACVPCAEAVRRESESLLAGWGRYA